MNIPVITLMNQTFNFLIKIPVITLMNQTLNLLVNIPVSDKNKKNGERTISDSYSHREVPFEGKSFKKQAT